MKPGVDYQAWVTCSRLLNANESKAREFRTRRYAFTHALANVLVKNLPKTGTDQVIYAVRLMGGHSKPVYLGSSSEGCRRLWDLPIGESHHLANTYPPEVWQTVQILHWRQLLVAKGHDLDALQRSVAKLCSARSKSTLELTGMGIEFRFQQETRPDMNMLTKRRDGGFKEVNPSRSKSRQAIVAREWITGRIYEDLWASWTGLQSAAEKFEGDSLVAPFGSMVFPGRIFDQVDY